LLIGTAGGVLNVLRSRDFRFASCIEYFWRLNFTFSTARPRVRPLKAETKMRLSWALFIAPQALPGVNAALMIAPNVAMSQNTSETFKEPAAVSLTTVSSVPNTSDHSDLAEPPTKEYAVFPVNPQRVNDVFQKIRAIANGGVDTQRSENRPEFRGVLYWKFNATESNARILQAALGPAVGAAVCIH